MQAAGKAADLLSILPGKIVQQRRGPVACSHALRLKIVLHQQRHTEHGRQRVIAPAYLHMRAGLQSHACIHHRAAAGCASCRIDCAGLVQSAWLLSDKGASTAGMSSCTE